MKNLYIIFPLLINAFLIISCDEDERRPLIQDSSPPNVVSNVEVENISGGANLTYTLPDDEDVLYVEAQYELGNGQTASVKSSIYNNTIKVEGFGDTTEHIVQLYAVDQSENRSSPVEVAIQPKTPPVELIGRTLRLEQDFGGVHLYWQNEEMADIAIIALIENEIGDFEQIDIRYSSLENDDFAIRGFDTIPRIFGAYVRDRFDNRSGIIQNEVKPLFEEELNKNDFRPLSLPHDAPDAFGWVMPNLFNDDINGSGFHTPQGWRDENPLPTYEGQDPHMFTIDLGVTAKLSRMKWWQRQGTWIYFHGNPRRYEVWGTNELNGDGTFDGWVKLIEDAEVIKPSGLPPQQNSNDDVERAGLGEEAAFPLDAPPVRYIRFVNLQSWSGARFLHMMEMEFFGEIQ